MSQRRGDAGTARTVERPEIEIRIGVGAALLAGGGRREIPELERLTEIAVLLPIPGEAESGGSHAPEQLVEIANSGLNGLLLGTDPAADDSRRAIPPDAEERRIGGSLALALRRRFPLLPVSDLEGLRGRGRLEEFVERALLHESWTRLLSENPTPSGLRRFHAEHRMAVMARSPRHFRELARSAARAEERSWEGLAACYGDTLAEAMELPVRVGRRGGPLGRFLGILRKANETYAAELEMRNRT